MIAIRFHQNRVRLAFGLDNYGKTFLPEIWYFQDNKIFDNLTLLKIVVETTTANKLSNALKWTTAGWKTFVHR
jgi:hypothetical protein